MINWNFVSRSRCDNCNVPVGGPGCCACVRIKTNPVKVIRKLPAKRQRAVQALTPASVEGMRRALLADGRHRNAVLVSVLAYAGLRPRGALALCWRHVRERTLLVEQAVKDGELKGQKTGLPPRTVTLLGPLKQDLAERRLRQAARIPTPTSSRRWTAARGASTTSATGAGGRSPTPPTRSASSTCPYDLRHAFASLLDEGRFSIVEIAAQLGHNPNVCLSTYAHVMTELGDTRGVSAEEEIRAARPQYEFLRGVCRAHIRPTSAASR